MYNIYINEKKAKEKEEEKLNEEENKLIAEKRQSKQK